MKITENVFKASVQFGAPERIWRGEVAVLGGFRVVRSNAPGFAAVAQTTTGYTNKVYVSFALARYAYQISDLQNLRVYVVAPGGQADPFTVSGFILKNILRIALYRWNSLWDNTEATCTSRESVETARVTSFAKEDDTVRSAWQHAANIKVQQRRLIGSIPANLKGYYIGERTWLN